MIKHKNILFLSQASMIAALYVVLTFIANAFGLASGIIQIRFSEALTILPFFTPAAIPGIFVGCLLSNILTGCIPIDVIFGSIASLIGAVGTYTLRKYKWMAPLPPIIANTLMIPFILYYVYQVPGSLYYFMVTVCIGEILSCYGLGMFLLIGLHKYRNRLFPSSIS